MDITKCTGEGCRIKTLCLRYTGKPREQRQSYFSEPPMNPLGECGYFWLNKGEHDDSESKSVV